MHTSPPLPGLTWKRVRLGVYVAYGAYSSIDGIDMNYVVMCQRPGKWTASVDTASPRYHGPLWLPEPGTHFRSSREAKGACLRHYRSRLPKGE